MKAASLVVLSTLVLVGVGVTHLVHTAKQEPPTAIASQVSPLERARQASFDIDMPMGAGSAVLVGRTNLRDDTYLYRAVTAHHVIEEYLRDIGQNEENADLSCMLTFQPSFHGRYLQFDSQIEVFDWLVPSNDWASFTFISEHRLECAEVATREEFEAIQAWNPIFLVASYGPYGQQCRKGVISTTHNVGIYWQEQLASQVPWNQNPESFFRFSMPIWYGDSGGPIFSEHGKLIGLGNAFTVSGPGGFGPPQQVTHSGVAVKAHLILEVVGTVDENFFKIED